MLRMLASGAFLLVFVHGGHAQTGSCCGFGTVPHAGVPVMEIAGKITQVRISPGQGMPSLVLKHDTEESILFLGSIRYLLVQDFNPKVGDEVVAKAYKTANGLLAALVTLPQAKKTIHLRDESGRPLWRGPRW